MSKVSYNQTFRRDLETNKFFNVPNKKLKKSDILSLFIDSIPKSKAPPEDYVKYLIHLLLGRHRDIANDKYTHTTLTQDQKECIKYLVANENSSYFFKKNITRGQVKLWFVLYSLNFKGNGYPRESFGIFTNWVHAQLANSDLACKEYERTSEYMWDFRNSESYYDTISRLGSVFILGTLGYFRNPGYGNSAFDITELKKRIPMATKIPQPKFESFLKTGQSTRVESSVRTTNVSISPVSSDISDIPTPPIAPSNKIVSKRSNLRFHNNGKQFALPATSFLYSDSFLAKEKEWLKNNSSPNPKNVRLSTESITLLRKVISNRLKALVTFKEHNYDRILMAEFITNFVIDSFTALKDVFYHQTDYFHEYIIRKSPGFFELVSSYNTVNIPVPNFIVFKFLNEHLDLICQPEIKSPLFNLMKVCFDAGFLTLNVNFEFTFSKFDLFKSKSSFDLPSLEDDKDIDLLLGSYAEYVLHNGAFSGHAELYILRNMTKFREFNKKLADGIFKNYNLKQSHIGGEYIKADGNCLIATFMFDYLKFEREKNIKAEIKATEVD